MAEQSKHEQDKRGQSSPHDQQAQRHVDAAFDHQHQGFGLDMRLILISALILLGTMITIYISLWSLMQHFAAHPEPSMANLSPLARIPRTPPPPNLQTDPALDEQTFRAQEEQALHSYGWLDRQAGSIHIPVERAKELLLQEGITGEVAAPSAPNPTPTPGRAHP